MTEETVDELEAQTRTALQREQFESEINYLRKRNKIDELEMKLIQGLAIDPEHPMVIETLAYHYVDQDQQKKSLPLFKKLIDLKPAYHKSLWQMGDIYVSSGDLDTAQVLVERALELSPNNPKYALTLVEIYYNRNQKEQAIRLMEDIVERRPENVSYRETLAKLYEEVNDYPLVVQCYESILLLDTKSTRIKKKLLEARTKLMK